MNSVSPPNNLSYPVFQRSERLTVACLLSLIGGFLDIYTYLYRGNVFANAVTGNIVLFGFHLANMDWVVCVKYFLAILFYALGVIVAEFVHQKLSQAQFISWHQSVLLLEIITLLPVIFIPYGDLDFMVNALISFVCALQVQTFRHMQGLPFASTMCTGNLRSGTESLFYLFFHKKKSSFITACSYYLVIICFIIGAFLGTFLLKTLGDFVFLFAPIGLFLVFFLIFHNRQFVFVCEKIKSCFSNKNNQ